MSSTDPFQLLDLKRDTATEADVKAAYAKLLKTTRPEDDRAAFMALRTAFSNARAIAKGNDARRAAEPVTPEVTPDVTPAPQPAQPFKWTFHKHIGWNTNDAPFGQLVKDTLEWMVGGGQDADAFVQHVAERLVTEDQINEAGFRLELIEYILAKGDTEYAREGVQEWEVFAIDRPEWLNDGLMIALADGLRLFKDKPTDSWAARSYNVVLALFQPVLDGEAVDDEAPAPIDAAAIFAEGQDKHRKDDHGSYFDKSEMVWMDMSPVGTAMRDLQAAIAKGLWDLPDTARAILERDDLQAIDEFQDLDARLRAYVCQETGWHTQERDLVYPNWLTPKLLLLFDDTFGWSRHHGRHGWERQQFGWLHKVIARDRNIHRDAPAFRAAAGSVPTADGRPVPQYEPGPFTKLYRLIYKNPLWLLVGYFGLRTLQVIFRMAA